MFFSLFVQNLVSSDNVIISMWLHLEKILTILTDPLKTFNFTMYLIWDEIKLFHCKTERLLLPFSSQCTTSLLAGNMFSGGMDAEHWLEMGYPAFTCSKLTIETLEQGVKYVKVNNKGVRMTPLASFCCLYC